jgi:hypothetical protein
MPITANGAPHQVLCQQRNHGQQRQAEQVARHRGVERHAQHLEFGDRHGARGRVVGQPLDAQEHPVAEELRSQRGHCQVQPFDAQAGQAKQDAEEHGAQAAQDQCGNQGHAGNAHKEVVGPVGAHGHEGAGTQRDLSAVAHQYVHAQRGERHDDKGDQDGGVEIFAGQQWHGDKGGCQHQGHGDAVLRNGEDLLVGAVARLELAVFAVEHGGFPWFFLWLKRDR